ncbi:MAG: ABC-F family ATP-binding cassette domain-containing protein [Clostridiales bacterium]|nr:ABC-F family ATP-binding cassette domain-containing protein [Clostridiales bacterium]
MIIVGCEKIALSFGEKQVLRDVTFSLNEKERLGIVGVNGSGKSTLIKILAGVLEGYEGKVHIPKNTSISVFDQHLALDMQHTLYEEMLQTYAPLMKMEERLDALNQQMEAGDSACVNEFSALYESYIASGGLEYKSRCRGILKNLGFEEDTFDLSISAFSGGQKTKIALAKVLSAMPDLLILDEPTNHLDHKVLGWLESFLASYPKTVLLISHDRYFLDQVTTKTLEIEHGKGTLYTGGYTQYKQEKKKNREIWQKHYENQQKEIQRLEQYIEQQRRWGRERNIIAAESRQKQLDKMQRIEKPGSEPEDIRLRFAYAGESGHEVIDTFGLAKSFGSHTLFSGLNMDIRKGDRVFVLGENGVGKSTLIKILNGCERASEGRVVFGHRVTPGYYDQENQQLSHGKTVLDELWDENPALTMTEVRNCLALFLFKGDDIAKQVGALSGGERARLSLAKLTLKKTNLLLLDEPTNHLDIQTREVLEEALAAYPGTLFVVSHDRYLADRLASRILYIHADGRVSLTQGTYQEWLRASANASSDEFVVRQAESDKKQDLADNKSSKQLYLEKKRQAAEQRAKEAKRRKLAETIATLESALEQIENELSTVQPDDYVRLDALYGQRTEQEEALMQCYEQWEELTKEEQK